MNASIIHNPDEITWDTFVAARNGHLLQTSAWGKLKSRFGWSAHRVAVEESGAITAGAQILFRRMAPGLTLAYVPRGPVADANDLSSPNPLLEVTLDAARQRGALALKLEFDWHNESLLPPLLRGDNEGINPRLATCIQPRTTIHVDLTRDLETILAEMKPKWRYNIRLAERKGITVREGSVNDLPIFYDLLKITSARDKFPIHTFEYYCVAYELLTTQEYARLFIAEYASEPLAAIFVTAVGREAIYLYGASSNSQRERMPNHALHWHAMRWAKARGCAHYDLWGVGATAEAGAGTAHGLYQFKQGFGGRVVEYAGAVDVVLSRWKYWVYERAIKMRRAIL